MLYIWKYPLDLGTNALELPTGSKILTAQYQQGQLCAWVLLDPDLPGIKRTITIIGTGHPIPSEFMIKNEYITTVQNGPFVWHIFTNK